MDVAGLLSTLSAAIKFAGELNEAGKLLDSAEWKLKVADLKSTLADAKIAVVEFKDIIDAREKEIERLKANFQLGEDCVRYEPFLYAKGSDGMPSGYPYCSRCEQIDGVMIKLTFGGGGNDAICPECKTRFGLVQFFPIAQATR
jgi:hypothetical protein